MDHLDVELAWRTFSRLFSRIRFDSVVAIALIVGSVASGIRIPDFLVGEIAKSRKLMHTTQSSISIADTGVGARGDSLLWNWE